MTPSTERCSSIFDLGPLNAQNLLPKICTKSLISRPVWHTLAHRPQMFRPTRGFSGWLIQWNHAKCCGADPCCDGNEIWARGGDPVAYRLVIKCLWIISESKFLPSLSAVAYLLSHGITRRMLKAYDGMSWADVEHFSGKIFCRSGVHCTRLLSLCCSCSGYVVCFVKFSKMWLWEVNVCPGTCYSTAYMSRLKTSSALQSHKWQLIGMS